MAPISPAVNDTEYLQLGLDDFELRLCAKIDRAVAQLQQESAQLQQELKQQSAPLESKLSSKIDAAFH